MIVSTEDGLSDYNRAIRNAKNASLSIIMLSGKVRQKCKTTNTFIKKITF